MKRHVSTLKQFSLSAIISAIVILCTGLFYLIVKSGIPYQDPTLAMQIQYSVNMGIGKELSRIGLCMAITGAILRISLEIFGGNSNEKE